jgi:uncharacterized membrane protein YdjX (TVP38/TMEM64 family)
MAYVLFFAALGAFWCSPLRHRLDHVRELSEAIRSTGLVAPFVYVLGSGLLVAVGAPRLPLATVAGLSFGFGWGVALSVAGALFGQTAVFLLVRRGARFPCKLVKAERFAGLVRTGGVPSVVLVRLIPLHGMVLNLGLAASPVSTRDYMLGSAIGMVPYAIPAVLAGTAATGATAREAFSYAAAAVLVSLLLCVLRGRASRQRPGAAA